VTQIIMAICFVTLVVWCARLTWCDSMARRCVSEQTKILKELFAHTHLLHDLNSIEARITHIEKHCKTGYHWIQLQAMKPEKKEKK